MVASTSRSFSESEADEASQKPWGGAKSYQATSGTTSPSLFELRSQKSSGALLPMQQHYYLSESLSFSSFSFKIGSSSVPELSSKWPFGGPSPMQQQQQGHILSPSFSLTTGCTFGGNHILSPLRSEKRFYLGARRAPLQQNIDFSPQQQRKQQSGQCLAYRFKSRTTTAVNTVNAFQ